jgi:transcriptional regulator with XRE-family HTH domain
LETLRRIRTMRGMNQVELAKASGVAQNTISEIELGKREARPATLRKLARALDVEIADFFEEADRPKVSAPSSQQLTLNGELEEERRLHYLKPWADYINLLANNIEREIDKDHVRDLNWWQEFNRDVISLTHLYNRILPPPEEQTDDERLELLRLSEAIDRLNEVADKMDRAMEPVIVEMHKEMYAKERERRKAAFNAIPRRGVA